jgi:hypothetical protein
MVSANSAITLEGEGRDFDISKSKNTFFASALNKIVALKHDNAPFGKRSPGINRIFGVCGGGPDRLCVVFTMDRYIFWCAARRPVRDA